MDLKPISLPKGILHGDSMIFMTETYQKAVRVSFIIKVIIYSFIGFLLVHPKSFGEWSGIVACCLLIEVFMISIPGIVAVFLKSKLRYDEQLSMVKEKVEAELKEYLR